MEERKLNEKESLELIAQMIQNTKNRLETNCGMPFLFWGYNTIFVSLLVWFLVELPGIIIGNTYGSYSLSSQEQELTSLHVISSRVSRLIWTK